MAARGTVKTIARTLEVLKETKDPVERLHAVRRLAEAANTLEYEAVTAARRAGLTWTEIGAAYGMSKQAAQQRFRRREG